MSITFQPRGSYSFELNVTNGNAATVFDLLGLPLDGESVGECNNTMTMMTRVLAADPANYTRETVQSGNFTFCGLGVERIEQYRTALIEILADCIVHSRPLVWS